MIEIDVCSCAYSQSQYGRRIVRAICLLCDFNVDSYFILSTFIISNCKCLCWNKGRKRQTGPYETVKINKSAHWPMHTMNGEPSELRSSRVEGVAMRLVKVEYYLLLLFTVDHHFFLFFLFFFYDAGIHSQHTHTHK